ncbi:uncharacterized protein LOC100649305 isoform X2 [Bombus terrestris]|uniref:Uncharacterized protein LOC100649305 isoform X2 n=1 Tax=Bombus terrestris TaxID=30195 RepID=A0A9C6SBR6_BOMTE|nr:uncharacterized protein LOC100649305 isoform X2 [Bombus terrestris]
MTNEEPCKSVWNKFCDSVNSGVFWTSTEFKSACPPKKKKKKPDEELSKGVKLSDEDTKDGVDPSSSKKLPYQRPSDICPDVKSSCYIKMILVGHVVAMINQSHHLARQIAAHNNHGNQSVVANFVRKILIMRNAVIRIEHFAV